MINEKFTSSLNVSEIESINRQRKKQYSQTTKVNSTNIYHKSETIN